MTVIYFVFVSKQCARRSFVKQPRESEREEKSERGKKTHNGCFLFLSNKSFESHRADQVIIIMSMEAQFYEARRRQSAIDRRQSFHTEGDRRQSDYQTVYIPVRVQRSTDKLPRCTCTAVMHHRPQILQNDPALYQRNRDIYP